MKIISSLVLTVLLSCRLCAAAETAPENFPVNGKGILTADELILPITIYRSGDWRGFSQQSKYFKLLKNSAKNGIYQLDGKFQIPDIPETSLKSSLKKTSRNSWKYQAELNFASPAETAQISLSASLPTEKFHDREILLDGKKIELPEKYRENSPLWYFRSGVKNELIIPSLNHRVIFRGRFDILLQDNRSFGGTDYSLRILFTPPGGKINTAALNFTVILEPYKSTPLDLRRFANMGFADEKASDGKGGWTDQGPENDLHMLPTGRQRLGGIDFEIINPAENNGKSCLMLSRNRPGVFPVSAEINPPASTRGNYLYLLHALAWPSAGASAGVITVTYADGKQDEFSVTGGIDAGNWQGAVSLKNGDVVWTGENKSAYVGLYRSAYQICDMPIRSISFQAVNKSVWGIVSASVSRDRVPRFPETMTYIIEDDFWKPFEYFRDVEKGSILDFSGHLDAPAGKYGPLTVQGGQLVFRDKPNVPVRFYGTNLCWSGQFFDKEWAERLTERIAAQGYNAVRLHHHDNELALHQNGKSTILNPESLDQLDYLIYCCRKRGIYYTTDLYVSRFTETGELPEYPGRKFGNRTFKPLVFVLDSAMDNWKSFAGNWLTHVNPYTGFALKDDPALLSLSLINEDNLSYCWKSTPESTALYRRRFAEWKKSKGIPESDGIAENSDPLFSAFLIDTYNRGFAEMKNFVRGLGVKTMISDQNMATQLPYTFMRSQYDYVDNHFYWSHPSFPVQSWQLPSVAGNSSAITAQAGQPGGIFPSRLLNKPMMITEFDYARPNFFRAEGAVLTGAYASLQDWNALFHFAYTHSRDKVMRNDVTEGHFDSSSDPVKALSQKIGMRLFLGREVKPAPVAFAVLLNGGKNLTFGNNYPRSIRLLGLIARVGTLIVPDNKTWRLPGDIAGAIDLGINFPAGTSIPVFPASDGSPDLLASITAAGLLKPEYYQADKGIFQSSTGQIELDSKKSCFKVVSPGCEALILPENSSGNGLFMRVKNRIGRGVFSVMSADGRSLAQSGRLLLLHLTDSQAAKTKFTGSRMVRLEQWGVTPFLAARGEAEVELAVQPGEYTVYAVDTAGRRLTVIPAFRNPENRLQFTAKVFSDKGPVFAYELLQK